ncbi:MAG: acetyl-CoA carboxylase biotin carboxyl carrier protein [Phycisphaerales bacterium]|nr:acetyl-CoA carboxylase biotin carboxyl carrier protein [Phycisphaerales bacterium]
MDIRKLKELVRLMVENDLSELDLKDKEETVTVKRGGAAGAPIVYAAPTHAAPVAPALAAAPIAAPVAPVAAAPELPVIESPMVGTFYLSAGPDKPPFVSVGSTVGPDTTVCLIEAMKIFNEIKAETAGTVEAVLVKSGQPIEFGQPLFRIRPA